MVDRLLSPFKRLARWFFGSPFQDLPPAFGDPVPSDLRVFEARQEEIPFHTQEIPGPASIRQRLSRPARRWAYLDRL